jgi:hypothetical protein
MKSWKGLVFFLLLNVLVSACATLSVLYVWDRNRSSILGGLLPSFSEQPAEVETPVLSTAITEEPQVIPTESFLTYEVKAGDDFSSIAQKFGVDMEELILINGFTQDQPLGVGEVLRIPYQPTPVPEGAIQIKNIVGAGDLEAERVLLKFIGEGELNMTGWRLEDEDGNVFLFPQTPRLILYKDGAIYIFTKPGVNSVIELFWGRGESVWQSGETATLRDVDGVVRATYQIP